MGDAGRLDGWKAIARFLGRDRSTAIRWANERGMPVHSLPGGKSRTVYALPAELEIWMRGAPIVEEPAPDPAAPLANRPPDNALPEVATSPAAASGARPHAERSPGANRWIIVAILAVAALLAAGLYLTGRRLAARQPVRSVALTPATRASLLEAQDNIASRSDRRLNGAIATLRRMPQSHPDVRAALAEAYLLAREFGSLPDGLALERARGEAIGALAMDPSQATALRVLGVVSYWRDRDPQAAAAYFDRAIAAAPEDALAHQWYANILTDNGQHAAALSEFARARQRNPGAPHLLTDYAWGLWSAGRDAEAKALLADLARRYPMLASVHDCLSVIALADGDLERYARHLQLRAEARNAPELLGYADLVSDAASRDRAALYRIMMARAVAQVDGSPKTDHSWPAFVASVFGDRGALIGILRRSRAREERWGASGYVSRMRRRWSADAEVLGLLDRLGQRPIGEAST